MIIQIKLVGHKNLSLEYFVYGNGEKWLLTFHGFGRDYSDFRFFDDALIYQYRIIGINLFHHGNSNFNIKRVGKIPLEKEEFFFLISKIIAQENINIFDVMAYSMGGKFAFCLFEAFDSKINKMILLAPDGIKKHLGYRFVTETKLGKVLSKKFIFSKLNPHVILLKLGDFGIVNSKLGKFVLHNTNGRKTRFMVYKTWQSFKKITPNHTLIRQNVKPNQLFIILGKHDQAIKASYQKDIEKLYGNLAQTFVLPLGHQLFKLPTLELIKTILK